MNVKYVSGKEKEDRITLKFAQSQDKSILQSDNTWKINKFEWNDEKVEQQLSFERIFMTENQEKVFEDVKPFVLSALNGKNVAIIAYGGTGSGKTYTMGFEKQKKFDFGDTGIFPRLLEELLNNDEVETCVYQMAEVIPAVPPIELNKTNVSIDKDVKYRVVDLISANKGNRKTKTTGQGGSRSKTHPAKKVKDTIRKNYRTTNEREGQYDCETEKAIKGK